MQSRGRVNGGEGFFWRVGHKSRKSQFGEGTHAVASY